MSTTGLGASLKYGGTLFGYFFLMLLLGGSGVTLGAILAGPELQSLLDAESPDILALSGGLLVAGLGAALVLVGTFSITFKLISDAVSKGINDGVETVDVSVTDFSDDLEGVTMRDVTLKKSPAEAVLEADFDEADASGRSADGEKATAQAVSSSEGNDQPTSEDQEHEEQPAKEASPQPEQSAEEIVFGATEETDTEPDEPPIEQAEPDEVDETGVGALDAEVTDEEEVPDFEELDGQEESAESEGNSWDDDPLSD